MSHQGVYLYKQHPRKEKKRERRASASLMRIETMGPKGVKYCSISTSSIEWGKFPKNIVLFGGLAGRSLRSRPTYSAPRAWELDSARANDGAFCARRDATRPNDRAATGAPTARRAREARNTTRACVRKVEVIKEPIKLEQNGG